MADVDALKAEITHHLSQGVKQSFVAYGELTIDVEAPHLREICFTLRDHPVFDFKLLVDVCGVDYLQYGLSQWETESATATGFERGVEDFSPLPTKGEEKAPRFAVIYHLLSLQHNQRIRIRVFLEEKALKIDSVMEIWPAANWFEREAFDLFGIMFAGHPDLRRILTDYGFVGHPFRKDFPLIGNVEVRYDAKLKKVIYEPVSITERVLEPKVIRRDNRYRIGE